MKKIRDLGTVALIYILAYAAGIAAAFAIPNEILRYFVFDLAATAVTFVFSVALRNSSVYDAYWSLTPILMALVLFIGNRAFSFFQLLFLFAFVLWGVRLTWNWAAVFTDFSYEDWRYRKFRDENPPLLWQFINFTGIHMVPTLAVFLGFLPLFALARARMGLLSLLGILVIFGGTALEFLADRDMHRHLASDTKHAVCRTGLWSVSRHPNYLGEISVWTGVWLAMLPAAPERWYFGIGVLAVAALFLFVSIPLMEKRQLSRRPGYAEYRKTVPCLIPLSRKHR